MEGSKKNNKHTDRLKINKDHIREKFLIALTLVLSKKKRMKAPTAGSNIKEDNIYLKYSGVIGFEPIVDSIKNCCFNLV